MDSNQMLEESYRKTIEEMFERLNISFSNEQERLLLTHIKLLMEKNKEINLTSIKSIEDALIYHIEDSLLAFDDFSESQPDNFCDIGTGGGFPGIPLAVMSGANGVLIDSIKKKTNAVQGFIDAMGLEGQLEVIAARAEELANTNEYHFDTIVTRAVSSIPSLLELASPLLEQQGRLILLKGDPEDSELQAGIATADMVGMRLVKDTRKTLGVDKASRRIVMFEKTQESSVKLPRRNGLAQKRPLVRY